MHIISFFVAVLFLNITASAIDYQSFIWPSNDRVNFTIYHESLCADCRQFIITQVWFAYQAVADIVNLVFIPYGNAHELYRPETQLYQFYCQHGPDECYGNLIETCAIASYPETRQHMVNRHSLK